MSICFLFLKMLKFSQPARGIDHVDPMLFWCGLAVFGPTPTRHRLKIQNKHDQTKPGLDTYRCRLLRPGLLYPWDPGIELWGQPPNCLWISPLGPPHQKDQTSSCSLKANKNDCSKLPYVKSVKLLINSIMPEFTIVIFLHYKPLIAVAILDL